MITADILVILCMMATNILVISYVIVSVSISAHSDPSTVAAMAADFNSPVGA